MLFVPYRDGTPCRYFLSLRQKISGKVLRKSPRLSHLGALVPARSNPKNFLTFLKAEGGAGGSRQKDERKFLGVASHPTPQELAKLYRKSLDYFE
jgi:hypothetical protein